MRGFLTSPEFIKNIPPLHHWRKINIKSPDKSISCGIAPSCITVRDKYGNDSEYRIELFQKYIMESEDFLQVSENDIQSKLKEIGDDLHEITCDMSSRDINLLFLRTLQ